MRPLSGKCRTREAGEHGHSAQTALSAQDERSGAGAQTAPLWTLPMVSAYLQLHPKTVQRLVRTSGLPCVRIGTRLRFDPSDVAKWVSARKEGA